MARAIGSVAQIDTFAGSMSRRLRGHMTRIAAATSRPITIGLSGFGGTSNTAHEPRSAPARPPAKPTGARARSTPPFVQKETAEEIAPNVAWPLFVASAA